MNTQKRAQFCDRLREMDLPTIVPLKQNRVLFFIMNWSAIFAAPNHTLCNDCGQLDKFKNTDDDWDFIGHCNAKGKDVIYQMTPEPVALCPICNIVFGKKEEHFLAYAYHSL